MELDQISSRDKNPLNSLFTARAKPVKANTKASENYFPLMKLLPELRTRIYECLFADLADTLTPPSLSTVQSLDDHLRVGLKSFLALLHTSQALRSEAIEVYCLSTRAHLATLSKTIQSMYAAIDVLGGVPDWTILMEAHARELVMGKLGVTLRVIKFVMEYGEERHEKSFAALKATMGADHANRMGCD